LEHVIKHPIWESVIGAESFSSFQQNILSEYYLNANITKDIKEEIELVNKLLLFSYYEYEFIDIALTQSAFILEKILKIRYKDINGVSKCNLKFEVLIEWFYKRNYFETFNENEIHQVRNIRNRKVHEEVKTLGGLAFLKKVYRVIDFINDLYEDTNLRVLRNIALKEWNQKLEKLVTAGAQISIANKQFIIFQAYCAFVNNKSKPGSVSLCIHPLFNLKPFRNNYHAPPPSINLEVIEFAELGDELRGKEVETMNTVVISKLPSEERIFVFSKWWEELHQIPNWPLIAYMPTRDLNASFIKGIRSVHKLNEI
jgi:hypothetical protein